MRACGCILFTVLVACGEPPTDGTHLHIDISSDTPFDRLMVFRLDLYIEATHGAPVTPLMLANQEPAPTEFEMADATGIMWEGYDLSEPRTTMELDDWSLGDVYYSVVAVGFRGETMIGGDAARTGYRDTKGAYRADVELKLERTTELFGTPPDCARVVERSTTFYAVRGGDHDCDNQFDRDDCQPAVHCTPDVPSSCACP